MATVTISLSSQIAEKVDAEAKKKGFATRSEFIRSLLRSHFDKNPENTDFQEFQHRDLAEIRTELEKLGTYSKKFIDSLVEGLSESSVYEGKTTKS